MTKVYFYSNQHQCFCVGYFNGFIRVNDDNDEPTYYHLSGCEPITDCQNIQNISYWSKEVINRGFDTLEECQKSHMLEKLKCQ